MCSVNWNDLHVFVLKTSKIVIVKLHESQMRLLKVSVIGNGYLKNSSTFWPSPDFSSCRNCLCEVAWSRVYACWCFRAVVLVLKLVEKRLWNCVGQLLAPDWWVVSWASGPAPQPLSFCKEPALSFLPAQHCFLHPLLWKTPLRSACLSSIIKHSSLCACQQQFLLLVSTGIVC